MIVHVYLLPTAAICKALATEIDCCRNRRQIGNNLNSTACRGGHCCQLGGLLCQYGRLCTDTVDFVANTVDFLASVYGAKATRSTFSKVDRVEFNFVASVYRAQEPEGNS